MKPLGGLRFRLHCAKTARCLVRFTGKAKQGKKRTVVLAARTRLAAGKSKTVTLHPNARGRTLARQLGKLPIALAVTVAAPGAKPSPVRTFHRTLRP